MMKCRGNPAGCGTGFTLLEVLVAMAIMATSVLVVSAALAASLGAGNQGDRLRLACEIAQQQLVLAVNALPDQRDAAAGSSGQLNWQRTYRAMPHNLMVAEVTVNWSDRGQPRSYQLAEVFIPRDE